MLSHAYHLNKHQIMITIRMIRMTITSTITIMITHGQELENTRALSQAFTTVLAAARDLGSLLLTRWHLRDIKVRDGGSDGTSRDGDLHPAEMAHSVGKDGIEMELPKVHHPKISGKPLYLGAKTTGSVGFPRSQSIFHQPVGTCCLLPALEVAI